MSNLFTSQLQLEYPTPGDPTTQNTWGAVLNGGMWPEIDQAIAGILSLSVAGNSNVVLTSTSGSVDQAKNQRFNFTGLLTGNIIIFWPNGLNRFFSVANNTTGAFTVTLAVNNGSGSPAGATIVLNQGASAQYYSDGTNIATPGGGSFVLGSTTINLGTTVGTVAGLTLASPTNTGTVTNPDGGTASAARTNFEAPLLMTGAAINETSTTVPSSPVNVETATIGGTLTAGDVLTIKLTSASITGSPVSVTYTTVASDTLNTMAFGLVEAINANANLIAAGITSSLNTSGPIIFIYYPVADTITFASNVSGAATETITLAAGSSSVVVIGNAPGNVIGITGTTTITGFDYIMAGVTRTLIFEGILTLTYNATSLILPGAANIPTAVGDSAEFVSLGAGNWQCTDYTPISGLPVISPTVSQIYAWGDGSDGNVTVSGSVSLTRDMYYNNLTIQAGAAITTSGYRIYVAGTLDISAAPAGAFVLNGVGGSAGGAGTAAAGGGAGISGASTSGGTLGGGIGAWSGGPGSTTTGSNGSGTGTTNANGGGCTAGGNGGSTTAHGTGSTGGTAGTLTFEGTQWPNTPLGLVFTTTNFVAPRGGAGGSSGAGGNGNGTNGGGGGGGGGGSSGVMAIIAKIVYRGTNTTAAIFQLKGGAGAAGGNGYSSGTSAGGGGGSGGGAGWLVIMYGTITGSQISNAIDISGGAGGNGGNGYGSGSTGGVGGGSGGTGNVQIYNLGAGNLTTTNTVAGTAGGVASGTTGGAGASANTKQINL